MKFGIHHSSWLDGPDPASFVATVSEAIGLIGQYPDAGGELLINSDRRNDVETREPFVSYVMPNFACLDGQLRRISPRGVPVPARSGAEQREGLVRGQP